MANKDGQICKQVEVVAVFDHDSKNFHSFSINQAEGVTGSIYILKGEKIPDLITVKLRTRAQADAETNEAK
jgi:hypothetical protein